MLQNTKELYGYTLAASDGNIGHVKDFYFDDKTWVVRYVVADTGSWLTGRLVLLSPHAIAMDVHPERTLHVNLLKKQIENSPSIETHKPVSRQYEIDYYQYYGWPAYWNGGALWGFGGYPVVFPPSREEMEAGQPAHQHRDDKHLQSSRAVTGYQIETVDGVIGHVTGFLIDEKSWAIRELVVEAGHWYAGKEVFLPPEKVERIDYGKSRVFVNLTKADIQRTAENDVVTPRV
jgi:hypothetical protein